MASIRTIPLLDPIVRKTTTIVLFQPVCVPPAHAAAPSLSIRPYTMASLQPRPHRACIGRGGSARDTQIQGRIGMHGASSPTEEYSTQDDSTTQGAFTFCEPGPEANKQTHERSYRHEDTVFDEDMRRYQRRSISQRGFQMHEPVPRSWEPAVQETIHGPEHHPNQHPQEITSSNQPDLTPSAHFSLQDYPPEQYSRDSWPLGMSNLQRLDRNRSPAPPLESWIREEQCDGPYNNVGSVGWQSEYDERLEWDEVYRHEDETEQHGREDEHEGYEYQSEDTFCDEEMQR